MAENPFKDIATAADAIKTPKAIFRERASFLEEATDGKVVGKVNVLRSKTGSVILELNAVVPTLGGYTVSLVTVSHDPKLYPCSLRSDWMPITQRIRKAANAKELEKELDDVLSSPELKSLVASVYAQARG